MHKMVNAISNGQQIICVLIHAYVLPREHINTKDTSKSAFNLEVEEEHSTNIK